MLHRLTVFVSACPRQSPPFWFELHFALFKVLWPTNQSARHGDSRHHLFAHMQTLTLSYRDTTMQIFHLLANNKRLSAPAGSVEPIGWADQPFSRHDHPWAIPRRGQSEKFADREFLWTVLLVGGDRTTRYVPVKPLIGHWLCLCPARSVGL